MSFTPREVLIPMVGGTGGALGRACASPDLPPPHAAQLDRSLLPLREVELYQAGQQAQAALRRLALPRGGWLGQPAGALMVLNPGDVVSLGPENSGSAELGLALALLMFHAQSRVPIVIATGALDLDGGRREVPVKPIRHLRRKMLQVLEHCRQAGAAPPPSLFLTPRHDPDGVPIATRYAAEIEQLNGLGVRVLPVDSLEQAARELGATRLAAHPAERALRRLLLGFCTAGLLALPAWAWLERPIPLQFAPAVNADGSITITPARAQRSGKALRWLPQCRAGGELPGFAAGEQLAVRVRAGSSGDLAWAPGRYYQVLVAVGEDGTIKVLPAPARGGLAGGEELGYVLDVVPPAENNLLVWLARRARPFDNAALEAELRRKLTGVQAGERISAVRNALQHAAPGVLVYAFQSMPAGGCE